MAIPTDPTVSSIITAGMKEAGQFNVSATQVTNFTNDQFQDLKGQFWAASRFDRTLEKEAVLKAKVGDGNLVLPGDFDHVVTMHVYYPASDSWFGTAQGGSANTITLKSTFSANETDIQGLWVFILNGTGFSAGVGERAQIIAYDDTTKVATVFGEKSDGTGQWVTTPDSTSYYLIGIAWRELKANDDAFLHAPNTIPRWYRQVGDGANTKVWLFPAADEFQGPYAVVLKYGANLTRLDESSTTFIQHLRERRAYWIEGIKYKTMALFDDDRQGDQLQLWNSALASYAGHNVAYTRVEARR